MSSRERLWAALQCQAVDRIPWSPFLAYWWESQPQAFQDKGQLLFYREIGADALLRGFTFPFECSDILGTQEYGVFDNIPGCQIRRVRKGDQESIQYETPIGYLTTITQFSAEGNTKFVVKHPVQTKEDFKILSYLVERMIIRQKYEPIKQAIDELGNNGLFVPVLSPFQKTSFQSLVEHFVGIQNLAYSLADYPEVITNLLSVMYERTMEAVAICVDSPAEAFISWEDTSTTLTSPTLFSKYIATELNQWGKVIHAAGKLLIHHACGHIRTLLPLMASESVDAVESISPPPTGNVEIWDAQTALGSTMGVIGGIEPTMFLNLDLDKLSLYIENLLQRMNLRGFILANSDSCPPGVSLEKFHLVTDIIRSYKM